MPETTSPRNELSWHLYLLECQGGSLYAGITNDLPARYKAHQEGKGAKYTRTFRPIRIVGSATFANRSDASKAEYLLKKAPKSKKIATLLAMSQTKVKEFAN